MTTPSPQDLNFPSKFTLWRDSQSLAIDNLLSSQSSINILSAPVGSGKTATTLAYARHMGLRVAYLTQTIKLQDQVATDFQNRISSIKGRSRYECISEEYDADDCGSAPCVDGHPCPYKFQSCLYDVAEREARIAPWGFVTSYAKWLAINYHNRGGYSGRLGQVDLLICDEGHSIDSWLTGATSIDINKDEVQALIPSAKPLYINDDSSIPQSWAMETYKLAKQAWRNTSDFELRHSIEVLGKQLHRLAINTQPWIIDKSNHYRLQARSLWPCSFIHEYLFAGIPNILITSATITETDINRLGIADDDFTFHRMDSDFPIERRPFYYLDREPHISMSRNTTRPQFQKLVDRMAATVKKFSSYKSIIHSVSHKRTTEICSMMNGLNAHSAVLNDIEKYLSIEGGATLIAATLTEGVDFPDNDCRLICIPKVPYVSLGDELIKARMKDDNAYYADLAARILMQMSGRGMRHKNDWCIVICYDAAFVRLLRQASFEPWFLETVESIEHIPNPLECQLNMFRTLG